MKYTNFFLFVKIVFTITNSIAYDPELNNQAIKKLKKAVEIAPYFLDVESVDECIDVFKPKLNKKKYYELLEILGTNCLYAKESYKEERFRKKNLLSKYEELDFFQEQVTSSLLYITANPLFYLKNY